MKLPIADAAAVRQAGFALIRAHRGRLALVVATHGLAAVCGLAAPWLVGRFLDALTAGQATIATADRLVIALIAALAARAVITRCARLWALTLGEQVFAQLREDFLGQVTRLPLSLIERAGTGDLLARTTNDIESVAQTVRFGVPRVLVAATTALLTLGAAYLTHPLLACGLLAGAPWLLLVTRWYLRRSGPGYQRRLASFAVVSGVLVETAEGARTVDALGLAGPQKAKFDAALVERHTSEWYTLWLRSVLFPLATLGFLAPVVLVLGWGAWLAAAGGATIGQVTAIALYAMQLSGPLEELIAWMDEIQIGATALSRLVGVASVPPDRAASGDEPADESVAARGVRFSYTPGIEVLHGVDVSLTPGERVALVGPSGSGKSTLGRLLAGIDKPGAGSVTVGGAELTGLPLDELRRHVVLVTQENHVFAGSLAENLRLADASASDAELVRALDAVGAWGWAADLDGGLEARVGSGGIELTPGQAQQLALARLVLLDPPTVILDEATSLIDPTAARGLERGLGEVLAGRTVVAIAHRLHTAHDADRILVMERGLISEAGTHAELIARGGSYAALWRAWQGREV